MVQIEDSIIESMKNLNKNLDWKRVREGWIIPMLKELNNIYDDRLDINGCENDFKAEYLAKIKAFGKLESIISKIDYYAPKEDRAYLDESFE